MTVFAWTAPGYVYPPYINVIRENGFLHVTVRDAPHQPGDGRTLCGPTSKIELDWHQAILLMDALAACLAGWRPNG